MVLGDRGQANRYPRDRAGLSRCVKILELCPDSAAYVVQSFTGPPDGFLIIVVLVLPMQVDETIRESESAPVLPCPGTAACAGRVVAPAEPVGE